MFLNRAQNFNILSANILGLFVAWLSLSTCFSQEALDSIPKDLNNTKKEKYTHYIGLEVRPSFIIPSTPFYIIENVGDPLGKRAISGHLKYSFALPSESLGRQIFPNTQQGIGLAYFDVGNPDKLGTPMVSYLFQSTELARFSKHVSLDYEWNFGLSTGWKPYDAVENPQNMIVGSRLNAYINAGVYLKWRFADRLSLNSGIDFTHFSNGNTEYPNSGFNTYGIKMGVVYDVSPEVSRVAMSEKERHIPVFTKHVSYDVVVFGSWRRKGVDFYDTKVASPHKYPVVGAYLAPMYNFGYKFRAGLSLDAIYDGSANAYTKDYIVGTQQEFFTPDWDAQIALGGSLRAEYIMPIFTIGFGLGTNLLYKEGKDFKGTYQSFSLKIGTGNSSFLHIGYNLKDFHDPNYLMLGFGYRFNNKRSSLFAHY